MRQKRPANFRLTPEAIMLLAALAKRRGISRAAVLELLIRSASEQEASLRAGTLSGQAGQVRKEAKHVLPAPTQEGTKEGAEKLTVSEGIEK